MKIKSNQNKCGVPPPFFPKICWRTVPIPLVNYLKWIFWHPIPTQSTINLPLSCAHLLHLGRESPECQVCEPVRCQRNNIWACKSPHLLKPSRPSGGLSAWGISGSDPLFPVLTDARSWGMCSKCEGYWLWRESDPISTVPLSYLHSTHEKGKVFT